MAPEKDVRIKGAYILHITGHEEDADGKVTQINATYYPDSRSGSDTSGVKAKGTLHWVDAATAIDVEVRNYDKLFTDATPMDHEDKDFMDFINPASLIVIAAKGEPALADAKAGDTFQFLRMGYYTADEASTAEGMVFNLTCGLKSGWKG
jgi:glutaminyl-tRNA synthetase